ncbi:MAG: outer membrane protein transport protein [Verrucomicrobiales bacterium]
MCGPVFAAEGLRTLPDSAEAMGVIGGRFTLLDDASVVRTNPATLTDIADTTVQATYQRWHGKTDYTSPLGLKDSMIVPWKDLGSAYVVHPLNDRLTAGLGVSAPFGVSINWPREGMFRYSGAYNAVLETIAVNPALGVRINDDVSLGFGLDIYRSKLRLEQRYPWGPLLGAPLPDGDMRFDGHGWGIGAYAGINFDLGDRHHFALVGRLPVSVDYEGDFGLTNIPAPGIALPESPFESEIEHPGSIGVGYGYDICENLRFGVDFEWIQNSTHDDLPLAIGSNQPLLGGNDAVPLGWDDSYSVGFGVEYDVSKALTLRAGYLYSDSPMNSRTYNPSVPANDRHIASIGAGYRWGLNSVDLAYSLLLMDTSTIRNNVQPAFNGTYKYDWNILTVSYTRRF